MRQRVAFLRTLVAGKPVLALDEPFASLDAITRAEMQEWLAGGAASEPRTVVLVTHDVEEALYLSDRVVVLSPRPARVVAEFEAPAPRAPIATPRSPTRPSSRSASVRSMPSATPLPWFPSHDMGGKGTAERVRRWLLPVLLFGGLDRRLAARGLQPARSPTLLGLEPFLVPSPAEVGEALWESRSLLAENAWVTLREILFGLACALLVGVGFAVLMHLSRTLRDAAYPLIVASQTIPIIVIAPILLVWLGFGIGPKLVVVALICFFPITVNVLDGLRSTATRRDQADAEPRRLALADLPAGRGADRAARASSPAPRSPSSSPRSAPSSASGSVRSAGLGHLILQDNAQLEIARRVRRGGRCSPRWRSPSSA